MRYYGRCDIMERTYEYKKSRSYTKKDGSVSFYDKKVKYKRPNYESDNMNKKGKVREYYRLGPVYTKEIDKKINKIIKLIKYLWKQGGLRNMKPLFLWLLIIPLRSFAIDGLVGKLRKKRVTFLIGGRLIEGKVAHIGTIKEVIVERGYELDKKVKGDIIDAGANIGIAQLVLKKMASKNSKMICVEPDPGNVSLLIRNQGLNCEILVAAISDKVGKANFSFASTGITSHFSNYARQSVKIQP